MTDERLDSLLLLACEKELVDEIKLPAVITAWAKLKQRRIKVTED